MATEQASAAGDVRIVDAAIIGSGFGGLCAAIKLRAAGEDDFLIFERASSVGGTWRDNHYPGCACDVPSVLYSLSFEQNADWSRKFPSQEELYAYLKRVAEKYDLLPRIRFEHEVREAAYDPASGLWRLETSQGAYRARTLISATGGLSEPAFPDIPGRETFAGPAFHSAQWDHDHALAGKRVAVIGSGASAVQIVPEVAQDAERLLVFQRTPHWVAPRRDRAIRSWEKALRRTPLKWVFRGLTYGVSELTALGMVRYRWVMKLLRWALTRHLRRVVPDTEFRARVTPDFLPGCKRILLSDDWYPALQRENVTLITGAIAGIEPGGLRMADGALHEVDVIVYATGFHATGNPSTRRIRGRDGRSLAETWTDGEEAYLGTLVHGFPNLFLITGPNTGIGHTSLVFMIEAQVHYIVACLRLLRREGFACLEVCAEAQARFNEALQQRMQRTVWASGCKSWYQHPSGKITTLWPQLTLTFWWRLRHVRREDLHCLPLPASGNSRRTPDDEHDDDHPAPAGARESDPAILDVPVHRTDASGAAGELRAPAGNSR